MTVLKGSLNSHVFTSVTKQKTYKVTMIIDGGQLVVRITLPVLEGEPYEVTRKRIIEVVKRRISGMSSDMFVVTSL